MEERANLEAHISHDLPIFSGSKLGIQIKPPPNAALFRCKYKLMGY